MQLRVATYNVENLFGRAKVLNFSEYETGDDIMRDIAEIQSILEKPVYSDADRRRAGALYNKNIKFINYNILRADGENVTRYLFSRIDTNGDGEKNGHILTPTRSDQWLGFLTYDRDRFSDETSKNTARVINEVDADILCINEIESRPIMDRFNSNLLQSRYPYNVLIDCITDPRGIDVGIYSKHPLGNVRTNIFTTDREGKRIFSRDCLEVEVLTPAGPVHVLANHLKSKSRGGDDKRKAQAEEIKSILETRYDLATDKVVVLGDLNDTPASDPLAPLLSMPALTDAFELEGLPDAGRWSYVYEGRAQQIDYILVSDALRGGFRSAGARTTRYAARVSGGSDALGCCLFHHRQLAKCGLGPRCGFRRLRDLIGR
ncbi:MAG: endonuclease/exonuclease/phosphatase family protein [Pseudomonadota bacterium]